MVEENIGGNRVVKAFARENYEIDKFKAYNQDFKTRNMASAEVSRTYLPWLDGLAGSLNVIALVLGGIFVINGDMTLGDLVAFNGYLWMLNNPMRMSGWLINDVQRFLPPVSRFVKCSHKSRKFLSMKRKPWNQSKALWNLNMFPFIFPMIRIKMFWKMLALKSDLGKR